MPVSPKLVSASGRYVYEIRGNVVLEDFHGPASATELIGKPMQHATLDVLGNLA